MMKMRNENVFMEIYYIYVMYFNVIDYYFNLLIKILV